jgi:hypothetical protein
MKYVLLIGVLLLTGCNGYRAWLAGYDEGEVRARCQASSINYQSENYDIRARQFIKIRYADEQITKNVERCMARSLANANSVGVPVVFTIPIGN